MQCREGESCHAIACKEVDSVQSNRGPDHEAEAEAEVGDKLNKRHGTSRYHQKVASWHQCGRWSLSSLPQPSGFFLGEGKKCGEQKKQMNTANRRTNQPNLVRKVLLINSAETLNECQSGAEQRTRRHLEQQSCSTCCCLRGAPPRRRKRRAGRSEHPSFGAGPSRTNGEIKRGTGTQGGAKQAKCSKKLGR